MRAVLQRVKEVCVSVGGEEISRTQKGLLVFLGIEKNDSKESAEYISSKILNLRIFEDENGKMNRSVCEVNGELTVVSQFTLLADCRKGNRPSFDNAASPQEALELYNYFIRKISESQKVKIGTGRFAAKMDVELINDGPVTIIIDSRK